MVWPITAAPDGALQFSSVHLRPNLLLTLHAEAKEGRLPYPCFVKSPSDPKRRSGASRFRRLTGLFTDRDQVGVRQSGELTLELEAKSVPALVTAPPEGPSHAV